MRWRIKIKHLPMAAMAVLLGICGAYVLTAPGQVNASGNIIEASDEPPARPQAGAGKKMALNSPDSVSGTFCSENIPRMVEELFPLIDEELNGFDWNADDANILRDA